MNYSNPKKQKNLLKAKSPYLFKSAKQVAITLLTATVCLAILEARGLVIWADRLEAGTMQNIAKPVVDFWANLTEPLGVSKWREPLVALVHSDNLWQTQPNPTPVPTNEQTEKQPAPVQTSATANLPSIQTATASEPIANASNVQATLSASAPVPVPVADNRPFRELELPLQHTFPAALKALSQKANIQVVLTGDSMMAVGLAPMTQQFFAGNAQFKFTRAFRSGTGLSRPDVFNWLVEYPKMTAKVQPDLVIVAIGANDAQDLRNTNGQLLRYGTDEWFGLYQERLQQFIQMVSQNNAQVIWLGLPVMRSGKFNQKVQLMNQFVYNTVRQYPNITWINVNRQLSQDGAFISHGQNAQGKMASLRGQDGIHISNDGASLLIPHLFAWYLQP